MNLREFLGLPAQPNDRLGMPPDWDAIYRRLREREAEVQRAGRINPKSHWAGTPFWERPPNEVAQEVAMGFAGPIKAVGGVSRALGPSQAAARKILGIADDVPYSAPQVRQGKLAYHGSPHKFDKFADEAIGTGEGAQAYGYGHYFADRPGVAKSYQEALAAQKNLNIPRTRALGAAMSKQEMSAVKASNESFRSSLKSAQIPDEHIKSIKPWRTYHDYYNFRNELNYLDDLHIKQRGPEIEKRIAFFENKYKTDGKFRKEFHEIMGKDAKPDWSHLRRPYSTAYGAASGRWADYGQGHLYKTALKVQDDVLLHWDKPLSEQPKAVREALEDALKKLPTKTNKYVSHDYGTHTGYIRPQDKEFAQLTGADIVKYLEDFSVGHKSARDAFKARGIKGIKYLDQGSRGAGEGTYNYVIFDPKDTAILKTMGIGGAGIAASERQK